MLETLTIAVVGAVLGMVGTFFAGRQTRELEKEKYRREMRLEYDRSLRTSRFTAYPLLWQSTGLLPQYAREAAVTYAALHDLSVAMRKWYFDAGGMYLTESSKTAYFAVQEEIAGVLSPVPSAGWAHTVLPSEVYETVRRRCSTLRSAMVADVGTRAESDIN